MDADHNKPYPARLPRFSSKRGVLQSLVKNAFVPQLSRPQAALQ
jgi:hypothetical protein